MGHEFSGLVRIDLHGASVRLIGTGWVTVTNQRALHRVTDRGRTLIRRVLGTVDPTGAEHAGAEHVASGAKDLLRRALEHETAVDGAGPVEMLTAAVPLTQQPVPRPVTALANHRARAGPRRCSRDRRRTRTAPVIRKCLHPEVLRPDTARPEGPVPFHNPWGWLPEGTARDGRVRARRGGGA